MATVYPVSTYSLATIAVTVASLSATPTYIWTAAVPSGAKGKSGILQMFFNLYVATNFFAGQSFNYGIYVDGVPLAIGDSTTIPYTHTSATPYALSSGGVVRGTNGFQGLNPIVIPVSFSSGASLIQIGISNSSLAMSSVTSVSPHVTTNTTVTSGTLNTANWIPINTFTGTGTSSYTVPTTVQGGAVQGVYVYCWGAGAGRSYLGAGSGGFASAYYPCTAGTVITVIVGSVGGGTVATGGGMSAGGYCASGGFSGVFSSTNITQSTALVVAGGAGNGTASNSGGGGGGGASATNATGTGYCGGPSWYWNTNAATGNLGGTLSGGGTGRDTATGMSGGISNAVSAGGGGYWGGAGGDNGGGSGGGGGGSSFVSNACSSAAFSPGGYCASSGITSVVPGGVTNPLYVANSYLYGYGGSGGTNSSPYYQGLVVIIPAIGASANQVGVQANIFVV
jgi:hypothetical protein